MMQATYLTVDSVSILTESDGQNYRKAYVNSTSGRTELGAECPTELVADVMTVWGDTTTMDDTPEPPLRPAPPESPEPTLEQRTAALEGAMLAVMGGDGNV